MMYPTDGPPRIAVADSPDGKKIIAAAQLADAGDLLDDAGRKLMDAVNVLADLGQGVAAGYVLCLGRQLTNIRHAAREQRAVILTRLDTESETS